MIAAVAVGALAVCACYVVLHKRSRYVRLLARSCAANAVPLGYLAAVLFFVSLFERDCINNLGFSLIHKQFMRAVYVSPLVTFALLYFSNPGHITSKTHLEAEQKFPYDMVLYSPNTQCRTCLWAKPARSKHCGVCGHCIEMQDHHCVWVNNCVGLGNLHLFLAFLAANVWLFVYGILALGSALVPSMLSKKSWWAVMAMGVPQRTGACLMLLCVLLLPLVALFGVLHLHQLGKGLTTNEADKREELAALIPEGTLVRYPQTPILLIRMPNGKYNRGLRPEEIETVGDARPRIVKSSSELPNIYDQGSFLKNLKFALSMRRGGPGRPAARP